MFGAPGANPTLQATAQPVPVMIGMAALHLLDQGDRPQPGLGFEHRADLGVPEPGEGVGTLAPTPIASLSRGEMPIRLDPTGGALKPALAAATRWGW